MWIQFLGWDKAMFQQLKWEWLHAETTVWSEQHNYAGRWTGWPEPRRSPVRPTSSWVNQTGNRTYPEVGMQLAALNFADYAFDKDGNKFALPDAESWGVLHVRPRFARLQPVEHVDECFKSFLGLRAAFEWRVNWEKEVLKMGVKVETSVAAK